MAKSRWVSRREKLVAWGKTQERAAPLGAPLGAPGRRPPVYCASSCRQAGGNYRLWCRAKRAVGALAFKFRTDQAGTGQVGTSQQEGGTTCPVLT